MQQIQLLCLCKPVGQETPDAVFQSVSRKPEQLCLLLVGYEGYQGRVGEIIPYQCGLPGYGGLQLRQRFE